MNNDREKVINFQQKNQNNQPKLTLDQATFIECPNCKSNVLQSLSMFMKFSKLLVGSPEDIIQPIPVVVCSDCGTLIEELLSKELRGRVRNNQSPEYVGNIDDNEHVTNKPKQEDLLITKRMEGGKPLIQG